VTVLTTIGHPSLWSATKSEEDGTDPTDYFNQCGDDHLSKPNTNRMIVMIPYKRENADSETIAEMFAVMNDPKNRR
jgi:hypothetical protein